MTLEGVVKTVLSCRPLPEKPAHLTKPEFVAIIGDSFPLIIRKRGKRIAPIHRIAGGPKFTTKSIPVP